MKTEVLINEITISINDMDNVAHAVHVRFDRVSEGDTRRAEELFLTPIQLEELGRFFITEAKRMKEERNTREVA